MFKLIKSIAALFGLTEDANNFTKSTDFNYPGTEKYTNKQGTEFNTDYVEHLRENDLTTNDDDK